MQYSKYTYIYVFIVYSGIPNEKLIYPDEFSLDHPIKTKLFFYFLPVIHFEYYTQTYA